MAAGVIGLGMAVVLGYRAARWLRNKYRWWMAPAGAAAAGYVLYFTLINEIMVLFLVSNIIVYIEI